MYLNAGSRDEWAFLWGALIPVMLGETGTLKFLITRFQRVARTVSGTELRVVSCDMLTKNLASFFQCTEFE